MPVNSIYVFPLFQGEKNEEIRYKMYEIHLQNKIILKLLISKNVCIQFK